MTRDLSPFLTELWMAVSRIGKAMTASDYRRLPEIAGIARLYHGHVRPGLDKLCEGGYLRRTAEGGVFQPSFWFSDSCKVPRGCVAPVALPAGTEKASARNFVNAQMPIDRTPLHRPMAGPAFDFAQLPSRRGNRLVYRDGRVTDLEGRPA